MIQLSKKQNLPWRQLPMLIILALAFTAPAFASLEKAPDFSLSDLAGKKFRLRDHLGKPILLIFSTTWCPSCVAEIPRLERLYNKHSKSGLLMININIMETRKKAESFSQTHRLPYQTLLDERGDVAGIYRVRGVPSLVLVNREGQIVCRACQVVDGHLERILGKK